MPVLDAYDASKAGPTGTLAFNAGAAVRLQVLPTVSGQVMVMLRPSQDVYLRQGDIDVVATSADFLLGADIYFPLLIETQLNDNFLSALGVTISGVLYITNTSNLDLQPNSI